jgi:hypothetical protein
MTRNTIGHVQGCESRFEGAEASPVFSSPRSAGQFGAAPER